MANLIIWLRKPIYKTRLLIYSSLLLLLTSYIDYFTIYEFNVTIFYLLSIFLVSIAIAPKTRMIVGLITAIISLSIDFLTIPSYLSISVFLWNSFMKLVQYIGIPLFISSYIEIVERDIAEARIDFLTGLYNRKAFYEISKLELLRSCRYAHPLSIAYIDCDNFKMINDTYGHAIGDSLLKMVAETLTSSLRETDVIARIGGDEFIVLFPETENACEIIEKVELSLLSKMRENNWPVTFSIGVGIFLDHPTNLDDIIMKTDNLMYDAKRSGKNSITYQIFD